jgi:putative hemolysin
MTSSATAWNFTPCRAAASRDAIPHDRAPARPATRLRLRNPLGCSGLFGVIESGASKSPALSPAVGPQRRGERRVVDLASGLLQVRLAETAADIDAAQALRYRIFYERLGARPLPEMARRHRDFDRFDEFCDHLLVLDHSRGCGAESVVGTYRLIRRAAVARLGAFYSAAEYDIGPLAAYPGEILELGRSCVDPAYRQRPAMQLLWAGIAAYVFHYDIALMFGCASLPGTDADALATPLSYLCHYHLAPPPLRVRALPHRYVEMRRMAADRIDPAAALAALPPLIKGYLRLGGFVGDGAVIDDQFNTTDVCVVVKTDLVTQKYSRHYERQSGKESWARDTAWAV